MAALLGGTSHWQPASVTYPISSPNCGRSAANNPALSSGWIASLTSCASPYIINMVLMSSLRAKRSNPERPCGPLVVAAKITSCLVPR